ncbi:hypothetical protein V6Z11_D11G283400 [Gossypium hirsutum]|uniref:Tyrosine-protein phosphatase non-receptor type 23-like n=1 Tax=Gossypium hirsutum TaxID=3635 RepID=A0A1U8LLL8_GOSHI|nr:tyrosine-protein phosphatase non-receptor type 23-like [Gossypium hirsutum]
MQQLGESYPAAPIEAEPVPYYDPKPELEQKPQPEPQPMPQPDPKQSPSHVDSQNYHSNLTGTDYFPSFSEGEYAYDFKLFGSYLPGPYPQHHETPFTASSLSMPNEGPAPNDFPSIFTTPPPAPNDDDGSCEHKT